MTLLLSSMVLCLTSSEESKLCLCLSLPTAALSSSVSNIVLLKKRLFKKSKRLLANMYVPPLFKCKPSLYKSSLVILSLLTNWNLFLLHSSCNRPLTLLMIFMSLTGKFVYEPFIKYVRKIFRKTNISNPLIRTRRCAYLGVRNVSFSENLTYVLRMVP